MPGAIAEEAELIGRVPFRIEVPKKRLCPGERLIAAGQLQKVLRKQELRNLHILTRLFEILLIRRHETKLMIGQLGDERDFYVLDKFTMTAQKALVLR